MKLRPIALSAFTALLFTFRRYLDPAPRATIPRLSNGCLIDPQYLPLSEFGHMACLLALDLVADRVTRDTLGLDQVIRSLDFVLRYHEKLGSIKLS